MSTSADSRQDVCPSLRGSARPTYRSRPARMPDVTPRTIGSSSGSYASPDTALPHTSTASRSNCPRVDRPLSTRGCSQWRTIPSRVVQALNSAVFEVRSHAQKACVGDRGLCAKTPMRLSFSGRRSRHGSPSNLLGAHNVGGGATRRLFGQHGVRRNSIALRQNTTDSRLSLQTCAESDRQSRPCLPAQSR